MKNRNFITLQSPFALIHWDNFKYLLAMIKLLDLHIEAMLALSLKNQ